MGGVFVGEIGDRRDRPRDELGDAVRIPKDPIARRKPFLAHPLRERALHEAREVELEGVVLVGRVGAALVANFTLEAFVDDPIDLGAARLREVVAVALGRFEDRGERAAQVEAEAAAVADVEDLVHRRAQIRGIPEARILGIVFVGLHRRRGGRGRGLPVAVPRLLGHSVEELLELAGVRLLGAREHLEPVGDLGESSSRAVFAIPGYIVVYS